MEIRIFNIFGIYCLSELEGKQLYILLRSIMDQNMKADLSFAGVAVVSSDFLEMAFGSLLKHFSKIQIQERINIQDAKKWIKNSIDFTIDLFERYYNDSGYSEEIDKNYFRIKEEDFNGSLLQKREETINTEEIPVYSLPSVVTR